MFDNNEQPNDSICGEMQNHMDTILILYWIISFNDKRKHSKHWYTQLPTVFLFGLLKEGYILSFFM